MSRYFILMYLSFLRRPRLYLSASFHYSYNYRVIEKLNQFILKLFKAQRQYIKWQSIVANARLVNVANFNLFRKLG